jgi:hypothetical protein
MANHPTKTEAGGIIREIRWLKATSQLVLTEQPYKMDNDEF